MKKVILALFFAILLIPLNAFAQSWSTEFNIAVSRTLAKNSIRGCGQLRWKQSSSSEFLVQCAPNGEYTHEYLVFTAIEKVDGPFRPGTAP